MDKWTIAGTVIGGIVAVIVISVISEKRREREIQEEKLAFEKLNNFIDLKKWDARN